MAERATFTGFDPYTLTGVRVTDRELGHGSYATVLELEYMGLKCAGKKIYEQQEISATLFADLRKNVIYSVKCVTPTLSSFWESISSKECKQCKWAQSVGVAM